MVTLVRLNEVSWPEAGALLRDAKLVILPTGSTEQHGPHCPLGTDTFTAEYVADRVSDAVGAVVLPAVPFGISDHHRQFSGTLWTPPPLYRRYILEMILSASSHGARKYLIINGHGGNTPSLKEVCEELRRRHGVFSAVTEAYPKMDGHAGRDETSLMLAIRGSLVHMDRAVDTPQAESLAGIRLKAQKMAPAEFGWDTIDLSPSGVFGAAGKTIQATQATRERGVELLENHIKEIAELAARLRDAHLGELLPKPHV